MLTPEYLFAFFTSKQVLKEVKWCGERKGGVLYFLFDRILCPIFVDTGSCGTPVT